MLPKIDLDLKNIRYPSTTSRIPRSIIKCLKLKANECRTLLLIAYPIFARYLPPVQYQHLQKLAFGVSIGESSSISVEQLKEMEFLLDSFVDDFPYDSRYIVQTVHCIKHFATTVKDFGPLFNYSTFNFENVIGENQWKIHLIPLSFRYMFNFRMPCFICSWNSTDWQWIDNKSSFI